MHFFKSQYGGRSKRMVRGAVLFGVCLLGTAGCGTVGSGAATAAQMRIVDATQSGTGLDIYAGQSAIAYNLGFGTVTSYVPMTPATYTLAVNATGSRMALSAVHAGLVNGRQYTLLMTNAATGVGAQVLTDQGAPAPAGTVSLRFLDQAMWAGAIDLYLVPAGSSLTTTSVLQRGLVYGSNTGYLNVATGTYTLFAVQNGTVVSTETVPLFTGASTAYPAGSARTVLILDAQLQTMMPITATTIADYDSATAAQ